MDWTTLSNSNFTSSPLVLDTAPFDSKMCNFAANCITQPPPGKRVDALSDRLMFRLAYRNFGAYQAMVLNHTVDTGSDHAGIRWYELRKAGAAWGINQQGTYAPDSAHRWMGSIAMDGAGSIALGFSVSSRNTSPSIRYTGRLATDTPGIMAQGESPVIAGSGSQTDSSGRWGDYSMMAIDPADDCTFWYTQEYYSSTSARGWQTRIASFKFSSCGKLGTATSLASSVNPSVFGQLVTFTATVGSVAPGAGIATGTVTFKDGAATLGTRALNASGQASFTISALLVGSHSITAGYGGDTNFNGSVSAALTQVVNRANTTTAITSDTPDPSVVGEAYTVVWSVTVNPPGSGTPTGTVTVSDGAGACSAAVGVGSCSLSSTTAGAKTLTAVYSGDASFNDSSGTVPHQVNTAGGVTIFAEDHFTRPDTASGWGNADTGGVWLHRLSDGTDASSKAIISSNQGKVSLTTGRTSLDERNLVGPSVGDVDIIVNGQAGSTGGVSWALLGRASDYNHFYMASLSLNANTLSIWRNNGGSWTQLATLSTPTLQANVAYKVRFQIQGSALRARFWRAADPEPSVWAVQATDSTFTSGQVGTRAVLSFTNSTANFLFDDFAATSIP